MQTTKKVLSLLLAIVMVLGLLPAAAFAAEGDQVYISISDEGQFITDRSGQAMAHRSVSLNALKSIDLNDYGMGDYIYDSNGDSQQDITALHLYIYTHEQILGLDWDDVDTSNGAPGSMYFSSGIFGYEDENLRYNYNGAYPADESGWGFTADNIVLKNGDYLDVAHFSDWGFYGDSAYGFNYFTDENDVITHEFTAEAGTEMTAKVLLVSGGMGMPETYTAQAGFTVYYGLVIGQAEGSVETDGDGVAAITFPSADNWYIWCDGGEGIDMAADSIVSSPASAMVTVNGKEEPQQPTDPVVPTDPVQPSDPTPEGQDVSAVLNATMAQLAATVTEPAFGTNAGEWTVLCLARGGYYAKNSAYFADYYDRIVETVNTKASSIADSNPEWAGALHKSKSTDNSRLIVALSAIGKDATSVGNWDLTAPYSDFEWIANQGINGVIWALIALDSHDYATADSTIRQQCVDYILNAELAEGGWALNTESMDVDITGMALQALYNYKSQSAVNAAAERAFTRLSNEQLDNGGFLYGTSETSESAAQVIVALTIWGINPDSDSRFVKNGNSVLDNLLSYYIEEEAMFAHQGTTSNNMATDQACYALVAYNRLLTGQPALYDFSDVSFGGSESGEEGGDDIENAKITAALGLPAQINPGAAFNGVISVDSWDNEAGYKLIDLIVNIPEGISVTDVAAGSKLSGGEISWNLEAETGKLRIVYFDANEHNDLTIEGDFPAELFTIGFNADSVSTGALEIAISGMSVKLTSDSSDENAMIVVNTDNAKGTVDVVVGISFSAVCLYEGDDVDLIPSTQKAVAVAITGISGGSKVTFQNETVFQYSAEVTAKTGVATYVALVDAAIDMAEFVTERNFTIGAASQDAITFGDTNSDGVVNAQDALAAVDTWLRKGEAPTDIQILTMNVNGDSRINTFDALGIVEAFISGTEYGVVTKAATITTRQ